MRSLFAVLDATNDEPFPHYSRASIREEKFILLGKAFLSALAVAEMEDLEVICSRLLPHKVTFTQAPDALLSSQGDVLIQPIPVEGRQPHDANTTTRSPSSSATPSLRGTTEHFFDRDLVAEVAVSLDPESFNNDEEMQGTQTPTPVHALLGTTSLMHEETAVASMHAYSKSMPKLVDANAGRIMPLNSSLSPSGSNQCAMNSLPQVSQSTPKPRASQSNFPTAFRVLTSRYGDHAEGPLPPHTIIEIIKLGDTFIRDDLAVFIESFRLAWNQNGVWSRSPLINPTHGDTTIEKLFNGLRCAEILEQSSAVDPVRLRVARVVLYHYYEQLCVDGRSDPILLSRRSRGRDTASVVTDKILEDMYSSRIDQVDSRTWKRRRDSLQKHKKIGVRISRMLDSLVKTLIGGGPPPSPWIDEAALAAMTEYTQSGETYTFESADEWRSVEFREGFMQLM
ncbi:hypothetical protein IQ07DRAFT_600370 [Pyrenochaeta sp. DS3sAY3a]|nr:hypothetical protein IQ07DRAFT_600370 [Pyrenochaeta sp. DS3sAY3a]